MAPKLEKIKVTNLIVNPENPRIEGVGTPREAILEIVKEQKEKLVKLAEDIVLYGLNPIDLIAVYPYKKGRYIVIEGNRRIVAIKLLLNPDLIPDEKEIAKIKRRFKEINKRINIRKYKKINCIVFESFEEAYHWIELRHTGEKEGKGVVRWDSEQKKRFLRLLGPKYIKEYRALLLLDRLADESIIDEDDRKKIKITNFERLINDPDVRKDIGIEFKDEETEFQRNKDESMKIFSHIIAEITKDNFSVKEIYNKENRREFMKKIKNKVSSEMSTERKTKSKEATPIEKSVKVEKTNKSKKERESTKRPKLIPQDVNIEIKDRRINDVYIELKKLSLKGYRNAVSVLFRVFIELSVNSFIERHPKIKPKSKKGHEPSLNSKIIAVADYLENEKILTKSELKGIRNATRDMASMLSTETFNAYVHNKYFSPSPEALIIAWDNYEKFMKAILEQ